jgi:hypothetical protein
VYTDTTTSGGGGGAGGCDTDIHSFSFQLNCLSKMKVRAGRRVCERASERRLLLPFRSSGRSVRRLLALTWPVVLCLLP